MSSGADHYAVAERLLEAVETQGLALMETMTNGRSVAKIDMAAQVITGLAAIAQVHATLAQAAAVIETAAARGPGDVSYDWREAVGMELHA